MFLNTRPGATVDRGLLQEVAQVYSSLWPALFNALANGNESLLPGLVEEPALSALAGRVRELAAQGDRLLVRSMRQQPLVMEASRGRVVIKDAAHVEAELLREGQQPGSGCLVQEQWSMRFVLARKPEGWRIQEADVRWQGS